MATAGIKETYQTGQDVANTGVKERGVIGTKLVDFYQSARGHLPNRYEVYLYGPYVEEALRVMDRNSFADKYTMSDTKVFPNTLDYYKKNQFDDWFAHSWDNEHHFLCMRWNAMSITIPGAKAKSQWFMLDTQKTMTYPLITKNEQPTALSLSVLDDSYMMWFQFFNALYNVQFSPLVLKPRSTMQKINLFVNMYYEAITMGRSHDKRTFTNSRSDAEPCITDVDVGQMFEFNSCILKNAPEVKLAYDSNTQYTFTVNMEYPNSFQGSFKKKFRYLSDNATRGVDVGNTMIKQTTKSSPYGEYNKKFYEAEYTTWQSTKSEYKFETYDPNDYTKYMNTHPTAFKTANKYNYDMHDAYEQQTR